MENGVSTSIGYGVSSSLSNTAYSLKLINTTYLLLLDTAYQSSDKVVSPCRVPPNSIELGDARTLFAGSTDNFLVVATSCDSKMDDDSEQEADDDMGYDPSNIYWIRGDDEVELTDEESSDDEDDVAEVFRIVTNIFDYETPLCSAFKEFNYLLKVDPDLLTKHIIGFKTYEDYKNDWIYEWNKDVPWVDKKPWTNTGVWTKPTPVKHTCKPFNYKIGCSEWPTCSWKDDGYCNGGNLPGTYIIENQLHYQDYEWYEALEDSELKDKALRNKAIMEGFIKEDDDESHYKQKNIYTNYDDA
ncbi:hypothetical protein Tco_1114040 [Tanacetum coccineum]|uniref:Uncharacterized protein n=1 Tax=Tanacetum coccineum TaxID=301880 RepID=A0ABQ5ITX3_9ASTR